MELCRFYVKLCVVEKKEGNLIITQYEEKLSFLFLLNEDELDSVSLKNGVQCFVIAVVVVS